MAQESFTDERSLIKFLGITASEPRFHDAPYYLEKSIVPDRFKC